MIAYLALARPVIGVGLLAQIITLRTAGLLFTALVAAVAAAVIMLISRQAGPGLGRPQTVQDPRRADLPASRHGAS